MENSIYHSDLLYNCFIKLNLCRIFPQTTMKHIMAILISVFSLGYHGKTIDFEKYSPCHRTTVAHFLNETDINPPAELGRLADASGDEQSTRIKTPAV